MHKHTIIGMLTYIIYIGIHTYMHEYASVHTLSVYILHAPTNTYVDTRVP